MEQPVKNNPTKVATKWAFIYTITGIIITYANELLNVDPNSAWKYVSFVPFIAFLLLAQKEFKEQLGGFISFGDAFSTGFRYSLFSGLLIAVFTYLYFSILNTGALDKIVAATQVALEDKNTPADAIEKSTTVIKKYGPILFAFSGAISYAFVGAIISLIGAAIFKKERSAYDIVENAIDPAS